MKKIALILKTALFLLLISSFIPSLGQTPPDPSDFAGDSDPAPVPIDGHIVFLVLFGLLFGLYFLKKQQVSASLLLSSSKCSPRYSLLRKVLLLGKNIR